MKEEAEKSLNPYYTGIHLHIKNPIYLTISGNVLILIILEYIYIKLLKKMMTTMNKVLILIILEYIYILQVGCCYSGLCLNPYYTGIHLH